RIGMKQGCRVQFACCLEAIRTQLPATVTQLDHCAVAHNALTDPSIPESYGSISPGSGPGYWIHHEEAGGRQADNQQQARSQAARAGASLLTHDASNAACCPPRRLRFSWSSAPA